MKRPPTRPSLKRRAPSQLAAFLLLPALLLLLLPLTHTPVLRKLARLPFAHLPPDPCAGRGAPASVAPSARPPTVLFVHVPKTGGTLVSQVVAQYARRTNGSACAYRHDGERRPAHAFDVDVLAGAMSDCAGCGGVVGNGVEGSVVGMEERLRCAICKRDFVAKGELLRRGACRTLRGHVTFGRRAAVGGDVVMLTVLREPVERFVSMYNFGRVVVSSGRGGGWEGWLTASTLAEEWRNGSSILHRPFYDADGRWQSWGNEWLSFFFYGGLHQLSGLTPTFSTSRNGSSLSMTNAGALAEAAMTNLCHAHVVGLQARMPDFLQGVFRALSPWAVWAVGERHAFERTVVNHTPWRLGSMREYLPRDLEKALTRRLHDEIRVYEFAERLVRFRQEVDRARRLGFVV